MDNSILISGRVINTVKSLPECEREAIVTALARELFLGVDPTQYLSPFENLVYTMISTNLQRDTDRFHRSLSAV